MNKRIFLPTPVRLFSCSEMDEYDADGVISSNGNGSLSQNMQSSMKCQKFMPICSIKDLTDHI